MIHCELCYHCRTSGRTSRVVRGVVSGVVEGVSGVVSLTFSLLSSVVDIVGSKFILDRFFGLKKEDFFVLSLESRPLVQVGLAA